jgi:hypothetical protein
MSILRCGHLNLHALLMNAGLDPGCVLLMRHVPKEPELRRVLPWLAAELISRLLGRAPLANLAPVF